MAGKGEQSGKAIAIYHVMRGKENFEDTADMLFQMVKSAATKHPGKPRILYLDIEGHRNKAGGFDHDAFEVQQGFILGFLGRWLSEVSMPLMHTRTPQQHEDVPESLITTDVGVAENRDSELRAHAEAMNTPVFDSDTGEYVYPDGSRKKPN